MVIYVLAMLHFNTGQYKRCTGTLRFLHCWLSHLTRKNPSPITYNVFGGTLNFTQPTGTLATMAKLCPRTAWSLLK